MDGVIANFDKRYVELFHKTPEEVEKNQSKTQGKKEWKENFKQFVTHGNFATLEMMPMAPEAINFLRKLPVPTQILSSGSDTPMYDDIKKQKLIWLQKYGITFNPLIVPGKKKKQELSGPGKILIDDHESNIEQWKEKGGIGILHKDWETTITILRLYV